MTKKQAKKENRLLKTESVVWQSTKLNIILWLVLSGLFGYLHMSHIETLFENDKHFSHLSNLERELSFRTESALYYYYFKLLVSTNDSLITTVNSLILSDNRTEHPNTINSLQRFNLYSELTTSVFYRLARYFKLIKKECWQVNRGDSMPPVDSCVGYLEPIYFYAKSVFVLNGFSLAFLFTLCYLINNKSITSGILGCVCYFYNHGESTRVMWTPALRESFSFPFHLLQMIFLTVFLQNDKISKTIFSFFVISSVLYLLTWQFAQFSLGSQLMSVFTTYALGYVSPQKLFSILSAQSLALIICYVLMFANKMLMTSFFAALLCSIWILVFLKHFLKINNVELDSLGKKIFNTIANMLAIFVLLFVSKKYILKGIFLQQEEDDSHIWDILMSKLNDQLHTFDTRLYTCSKEFDYLEYETFLKLTRTFLLPLSILCFIYYLVKLVIEYFSIKEKEIKIQSVVVYNMFQLIAFSLMAFIIMRLKLFWVPQLCVFVSFLGNNAHDCLTNKIISLVSCWNITLIDEKKTKLAILVLLIGLMSYQGIQNIKQQHNIQGEYSDYTLEAVMNWINKNTRFNDSFAASMPLSANLKLSTNRRIINHPHYEDTNLRMRIKKIYSFLYGLRPVSELHNILKNEYKTKYLIIERHYCFGYPPGKPECAMLEISHLDMARTAKDQACALIFNQESNATNYFLKKFQSSYVAIFKVI